jgi:hypothetical protein
MKTRPIVHLLAAFSLLGLVPFAQALTYNPGDVLLVFRSPGLNDVEFDLGSISQFLNHTNGYTVPVNSWSPSVVNSNYSLNGGNVQFALLASTSVSDPSPNAWISDGQPLISVSDITPSRWSSGLAGQITAVGNGAAADPLAPANVNYDVVVPTSHYSFDNITSNNGNSPGEIPYLGGASGIPFQVTGPVPATLLFYQISPTNAAVKPAATLVGSFVLDSNGNLTFQSGPLLDATTITAVTDNGGSVAVTFNTKAAVKYRLLYTTDLTIPKSAWTILPTPMVGDGNPQVLYDNPSSAAARYYAVESYQ